MQSPSTPSTPNSRPKGKKPVRNDFAAMMDTLKSQELPESARGSRQSRACQPKHSQVNMAAPVPFSIKIADPAPAAAKDTAMEDGSASTVFQRMIKEKPQAVSFQAFIDRDRAGRPQQETGPEQMLTDDSSQQQNQQNTSTGGSNLFGGGNTQQQNQPQQASGMFSNLGQQSQTQQQGGLFGTSNTQQANTTGGAGSLFGGGNTQQSNATGGGGLFGGGNTQQNTTQGTSSLFGTGNNVQQNTTQGGSSMFGGNNANTQQSQPQAAGTGSLFGGGFSQNNANQTSNLFSEPLNQPANNNLGGSMFGSSAAQPNTQRSMPSLLGATQHAQVNNSAPFGRLSMGQSAAAPTTNTQGAVKVNLDDLRPTTRFEDCIDPLKQELEAIDKMIQQQEHFCKQIEAFLPKHEEGVNTIAPDVDFIKNKAEDVEQALAVDAHGVDAQRKNTEKDYKDLERCQRIVTNLALPQSYQYGNSISSLSSVYGQQRPQQQPTTTDGDASSTYDTDLINKYFVPMAGELQQTMSSYANNLSEIENHMRVIESSAVAQAEQLAQRQAGLSSGGQPSSDDTVRELAGILRGFEQSILGVAGDVGECREGLTELVLGRLNGRMAGGY